jgi:hypothetical protein
MGIQHLPGHQYGNARVPLLSLCSLCLLQSQPRMPLVPSSHHPPAVTLSTTTDLSLPVLCAPSLMSLAQFTLHFRQLPDLAQETNDGIESFGMSRVAGSILLLVWLVVLVGATTVRAITDYSDHFAQPLHWFETFFRIGSLIYGGGQVVLPMLLTETVQYDCFVDMHGQRVRLPFPLLTHSHPPHLKGCFVDTSGMRLCSTSLRSRTFQRTSLPPAGCHP